MTLRPFPEASVSEIESRPHHAPARRDDDHEHGVHSHPDQGLGAVRDEAETEHLLHADGEGGVLRAVAEDGVLRHGGEDRNLRLPLEAAPGDETEAAWREFHARLRSFVARRVAVPSDADDLVQGVFLQLHRNASRLRSTDRIGAWLHRAARNAVIDHYRSAVRRHEVPSGDAIDIDAAWTAPAAAADEPGGEQLAVECLRPMLHRLSESDRRALEAVELTGLTQRDAAMNEGITLTAMKTRVQRARTRLKREMLACCRFVLDGRGRAMSCEDGARESLT